MMTQATCETIKQTRRAVLSSVLSALQASEATMVLPKQLWGVDAKLEFLRVRDQLSRVLRNQIAQATGDVKRGVPHQQRKRGERGKRK